MINQNKSDIKAFLFDFDGVVMDTETLYTQFWGTIGRTYHPEIENFELIIKGSTLNQIFNHYFKDNLELQQNIYEQLNHFEHHMPFQYIAGCYEWLQQLQQLHIPTAIVTSSDNTKMSYALKAHPELKELFQAIITANDFTHSKPDPDGYLTAARHLGIQPEQCVVFEDSFHGIESGHNAGMRVVGIASTNPPQAIAPFCELVLNDFVSLQYSQLILQLT